jgi:hypothetical protein
MKACLGSRVLLLHHHLLLLLLLLLSRRHPLPQRKLGLSGGRK